MISRRALLGGMALPALDAMFNGHGDAWADGAPVETRFVFWFNGNGIPEKFWIPRETGADYTMTPCLTPLAPIRRHVHVVTGLVNEAARQPGPGNGHTNSMSGIVSGVRYTGRGAGGASIDQAIAAKIGHQSRFRSLQIGVASESFGESLQRNMSWVAANRPLPPELLPHRLFDRMFGQRELGWVTRQKSVLDAIRGDAADMRKQLGQADKDRLDEHLASVRDLERAIGGLPAEYRVELPEQDGDMRDWPRIAKLQTELLVHAFASRQTRVASYMLTKCQSLTRFPWLGLTVMRHHDYTHTNIVPGTGVPGARALTEICRWHVAEFAALVARLRSVREGDGTLLDRTCLLYVHEHAEANDHKNIGHSVLLAGGAGNLRGGLHTRVQGTFGDLYLTAARAVGAGIEGFPTGSKPLPEIFAG